MPFGKYKNKPLFDVPSDYLRWVFKNCINITPELRRAIVAELTGEGPSRPDRTVPSIPFADLIPKWYRKLSMEFHPDQRGSHDAMIAVNRAKDLLVEMSEADA